MSHTYSMNCDASETSRKPMYVRTVFLLTLSIHWFIKVLDLHILMDRKCMYTFLDPYNLFLFICKLENSNDLRHCFCSCLSSIWLHLMILQQTDICRKFPFFSFCKHCFNTERSENCSDNLSSRRQSCKMWL